MILQFLNFINIWIKSNQGKMVVPASPKREQVLKMIDEKEKIERQINDFGRILNNVSKIKLDAILMFILT